MSLRNPVWILSKINAGRTGVLEVGCEVGCTVEVGCEVGCTVEVGCEIGCTVEFGCACGGDTRWEVNLS
jgi:hypothetical protein